MVKVNIIRDSDGKWTGMEITGHSDAPRGDEYDLVCCAISFHFQTIVGTLERDMKDVSYKVGDGFLKCVFDREKISEDLLQGIEDVFFTGIILLQEAYGKFIDVQ